MFKKNICFLLVIALFGGCTIMRPVSDRNSRLTLGSVQLNLKIGVTTKSQVLEKFGSPNITTRDGRGREVWTYQRSAEVSQSASESGYFTVFLFGSQNNSYGSERTSRMITLIIKFDANDIVVDFNSRTSNF